ncbi:MAG TPA: DNA polymerase III subunit beta [Candidatus Limosilactobacillus merdipullorum]|uniref:Beta sliding clamp n=1 Tax=Candidatus Limosilactobacillus merdipullorum TaxID=2838653 RepID=A0A9D1U2S4_9LACO|nr:DNA polymerase III subunit beta [Candidatus Limosilactobacillus merdipullorum]
MKFTINRAAFISQLNNVLRAISSKTTLPILTGLKMVISNKGILLTGSNSDITIESSITSADEQYELTVDEPGAIVLPARFFIDIIKKLPDKNVTIEVASGFEAQITSGQAEFKINGQDANAYPKLPEIDAEDAVQLAPEMLKEVINQTVIAVSNQESRPVLTGIHVTLANGLLTAVATDSHRLAQRKVNVDTSDQQFNVVIPGKSLQELSRMIGDGKDDVKLQIADNLALFTFGNIRFLSRLIEESYPETDRLIPTTSDTVIEVNAADFLSSIERASLLSHESRNNVVKLTMDPDATQAKISGNSPDVGYVEEQVAHSSLTGQELEISFNPDYMKDALRSFGQAKITMSFTSPLRPFTLVPDGDGNNFVQLITPVRTI